MKLDPEKAARCLCAAEMIWARPGQLFHKDWGGGRLCLSMLLWSCSLLAGTKWWRACWSWSAFLWCHWLSVNYNITSPPPLTIIQKFTVTQCFTWANKSTEMASCLVSQHGQSIRGHYLYQIEIRGNLSAVKSVINLPNTSHSQRAKSGETTVGNSFKRILSHWFTKERAFSENIVLSVCSGSIFNVYSFGCFTGKCKSEKCRSCTGVCKMNTTQHSRLHPLLAQLLRHGALCAEGLGKKRQHGRTIISPFQGEDEIYVISWDLCLSHCCAYVCLWESLAKLFIVTLRGFCKAMPLAFLLLFFLRDWYLQGKSLNLQSSGLLLEVS